MNKIFAVTLNYKTYDCLEKSLTHILGSILPKDWILEIIVIDSEFDVERHNLLKKKFPKVFFIKEKNNLGVGGGFNKGFSLALNNKADFIFMFTPDIYIEKDTLSTLTNDLLDNSSIGMVTPKILLQTNPPSIYFVGGRLDPRVKTSDHIGYRDTKINKYDKIVETDFVNCAAVLVKREIFDKVGGLDKEYFLYYEDIDWAVRVKKAGYKLLVDKRVIAWHEESSSVGKGSLRQEYYISRNHLRFIKNNFGLVEQLIAYAYVIKNDTHLLVDLFSKAKSKRAYYKLLGIVDLLKCDFGYKNIDFK